MEEYVGNEEKATPELQIMVMQEEREETEQPFGARKETEQPLRKIRWNSTLRRKVNTCINLISQLYIKDPLHI